MHLHLDPLGGLAGDMFAAALLDARPDLREPVLAAIRAAGLPLEWSVGLLNGQSAGMAGSRFRVEGPHGKGPPSDWKTLREALRSTPVSERAIAIFALLAEAEGAVHGLPPDKVHFHEVAHWDSVADIVAAATLIEALAPFTCSVGPLPLGSGRIKALHGALPVPAPATARLIEGLETLDDGIPGERVTPTGAAILKHLDPQPRPARAMRLTGTGTGLGTRDLPGVPNMLRVLFLEDGAEATPTQVAVLAFEVDDQSPEDLAIGLEHLRTEPGVLDVLQSIAHGKKGRLATQVQVLCRPEAREAVTQACFAETTTIGLRWHLAERTVLERRQAGDVKVVQRPGGATAKLESGSLTGIRGHAARQAARRQAEDEAE